MKKILVAGAFLIGLFAAALGLRLNQTIAQGSGGLPFCPAGLSVAIPANNVTVSGTVLVRISVGTTTLSNPEKMVLLLDEKPIGQARVESAASPSSWVMPWPTQLAQNGAHVLKALVSIAAGQCVTQPVNMTIQNTQVGNLQASITPPTWAGPTNINMDFIANVNPVVGGVTGTADVRRFMVFDWKATAGALTFVDQQAHFSSGPLGTTGSVGYVVQFGGAQATAMATVTIAATTSSGATNNGSTSTQTAPSTTNGTQGSTNQPTTATGGSPNSSGTNTQPAQINSDLEKCIVAHMTVERYKAIIADPTKQTPEEIKLIQVCLAPSNYVMPRTLAPVAPDKMKDKPVSNDVAVQKIENKVMTISGSQEKIVLKLSGKAKPSSVVLVYVFSEPLVLTTTADQDGNWSYTLSDPMSAGEHEAYALVDSGDGVYQRSNPLGFVIGKAEATAQNPNGFSLSLEGTGQAVATSQVAKKQLDAYMLIAGGMLLAVIVAGLFVTRRVIHRHHAATQAHDATAHFVTGSEMSASSLSSFNEDDHNE